MLTRLLPVRYTGGSAPETGQTTGNEDGTHEKTQYHLPAAGSPDAPDQLSAGGFTDIKTEKTTVTFAGTEHDGIIITASVQSTAVHEVLACVKVGNYVAVITAVTFGDSNPSEILDLFKAI